MHVQPCTMQRTAVSVVFHVKSCDHVATETGLDLKHCFGCDNVYSSCRCRGAHLIMSSTLKIISEASVADRIICSLTCEKHNKASKSTSQNPIKEAKLAYHCSASPAAGCICHAHPEAFIDA